MLIHFNRTFEVVVSNIFYVHPLFGEDSHFDLYFWDGLKPPTSFDFLSSFMWFAFNGVVFGFDEPQKPMEKY